VAAGLAEVASALFARLFLLKREALILFPAFGAFFGIVSTFVVSHKTDLRPLVHREQRERMG
jgi:hypothetical protein